MDRILIKTVYTGKSSQNKGKRKMDRIIFNKQMRPLCRHLDTSFDTEMPSDMLLFTVAHMQCKKTPIYIQGMRMRLIM